MFTYRLNVNGTKFAGAPRYDASAGQLRGPGEGSVDAEVGIFRAQRYPDEL